jgi:hypothetical protein
MTAQQPLNQIRAQIPGVRAGIRCPILSILELCCSDASINEWNEYALLHNIHGMQTSMFEDTSWKT